MLLPYPIPFLRSWGDHCLRHPGQSQPQISNLRKVLWLDFELAPGSFVLDSRVKTCFFGVGLFSCGIQFLYGFDANFFIILNYSMG